MEDSALMQKLNDYLELDRQREALDSELQESLEALREAAGKSTFKAGDQWYQVRVRGGLRYMCKLDGPPRGRPRKGEHATPPELPVPPNTTNETPPAEPSKES